MTSELRRELIHIEEHGEFARQLGMLEIVERDDDYWHLRVLTEFATVDLLLRTRDVDKLAKLLTWRAPRCLAAEGPARTALSCYLELERRMMAKNAEADAIRDEMDGVWKKLSDKEIEELNTRGMMKPPPKCETCGGTGLFSGADLMTCKPASVPCPDCAGSR
jgi:hypothetical protein